MVVIYYVGGVAVVADGLGTGAVVTAVNCLDVALGA